MLAILLQLALLLTGCTGYLGLSVPTPSPALSQPVASPLTRPAVFSAEAPTPPYPTPVRLTPSPTLTLETPESATLVTFTPSPTGLPTPTQPPAITSCPCQIKHVVIISVDGLRPDAIEQADTPTLDALRTQGAYSPAAKTVLPSVTLVGHASMLGGMSPAKHGIYWNSDNPDLGKIKGPTLFSAAHEAGLSTAMVVGKPKLEHLVLPGSVDNYIYAGFTDRQVADEAITLIQTDMPVLLFIHLPDVDSVGHAVGWMSLAQLLALKMTDSLIGKIAAALQEQGYFDQTLLIITADHGGNSRQHGSDSPEDMTIPWLAVGPGVPVGLTLQNEIVTFDTAATALYALHVPIPPEWDGRPVLEIFEQASP